MRDLKREQLKKIEKAIETHDVSAVEAILDESPRSLLHHYSDGGFSLMDRAIQYRDIPIMNLLIKRGFNINTIDDEEGGGMGAVHYAAREANLEIFNHVLSFGPDSHLKSRGGSTLLHFCAASSKEPESAPVLQLLISKGFELDLMNKENNTPLMVAVNADNVLLAKILIQSGASLETPPSVESILDLTVESSEMRGYLMGVLTAMREQKDLEKVLSGIDGESAADEPTQDIEASRRNHKRI